MADAQDRLKGLLQIIVDCVKAAVAGALGIVVVTVAVVDFKSICAATQQLLAKAGDARELEVAGFKLSLNEDSVAEALAEYAADPSQISPKVTQAIRALRPDEFARLMEVGALDGLCEYTNPDAKMRADVAVDYGLAEKNLTRIVDSPDTLTSVNAYLAEKAAAGDHNQNGRARSCYDMTLTDLGRNVKTGLVQSFKMAFDPVRDRAAPAPAKREMAQR